MKRHAGALAAFLFAAGLLSCDARGPAARVTIAEPADGAVLPPGDVHVVLRAEGIEIAPASDQKPGTAHHHLFVDRDLTPLTDTIPSGVTGILHLGRGQTEFTLQGLEEGQHRVIALLADPAHVPIQPPAADTVRFALSAGTLAVE